MADVNSPSTADIFSAFGLDASGKKTEPPATLPPDGQTTPPADPPKDDSTPPADPPKDDTPPADGEGKKDGEGTPPAPPPDDKAAHQFAAMRVQLKQYDTLLSELSKLLGISETLDANARMEALKDAIIKGQAKQTGISEDILRRQKSTDEKLAQYEADQHATKVYGQFQKVMTTFNLDQAGLQAFAKELADEGINVFDPANTGINLVREYRDRHFEQIIAAERKAAADKALEDEKKRAEKANNHSSTPPGRQGAPAGDGDKKIETQSQLASFLDGLVK